MVPPSDGEGAKSGRATALFLGTPITQKRADYSAGPLPAGPLRRSLRGNPGLLAPARWENFPTTARDATERGAPHSSASSVPSGSPERRAKRSASSARVPAGAALRTQRASPNNALDLPLFLTPSQYPPKIPTHIHRETPSSVAQPTRDVEAQ